MNNPMKTMPFSEDGINWEELAGIGILRDEIERNGELERLLSGESTGVMTLKLVVLGADIELDAAIRMVREGEQPKLEIMGIRQVEAY